MQAVQVIAIRHGETQWNSDKRIQGKLDVALNEKGLWQARRVAQALEDTRLDCIYSSDLKRAWVTAEQIKTAQKSVPLVAEKGLRERGFGFFEGKTYAEIEQNYPELAKQWTQRDPHFAPEGGESLLDFRARILGECAQLLAPHMGQTVVLVAHGGVMDVLYRAATHQEIQAPRTWNLGNALINRLLWSPEGFSLVGWADDKHLELSSLDEVTS